VHSHLIKRKSHLPTHAINIDTPRRSLRGKKKSVISRIFATRQIKATPANLRSENSGNQRVDPAERRKSECRHFNGTRSRDAHLGIVPVLSNARRAFQGDLSWCCRNCDNKSLDVTDLVLAARTSLRRENIIEWHKYNIDNSLRENCCPGTDKQIARKMARKRRIFPIVDDFITTPRRRPPAVVLLGSTAVSPHSYPHEICLALAVRQKTRIAKDRIGLSRISTVDRESPIFNLISA